MAFLMKRLARYFIKGLLVLLPIGLTVYFVYAIMRKVDTAIHTGIPGAGIIIVVAGITLTGVLFSGFIGRAILSLLDELILRIPLVKIIYGSVKDMIEAFVGDKKKFNEAVLVEMDALGTQRIGFVTRRDMGMIGMPGKVVVYFPLSYSLTGYILVVSADRIQPIAAPAADVMKFVVSGGITGLHE